MKKVIAIILCLTLTHTNLFSQDTYIRPAVSVINVDYSNSKSILDLNSVVFPKNLDEMSLSIKKFSVNNKAPKIMYTDELDGLSTKEIAGRMSVPQSTVETRLTRALKKLRQKLDQQFDNDRAAWAVGLLVAARLCCRVTISSAAISSGLAIRVVVGFAVVAA